ncbi:MAG: hypothetical protein J4F43_11220 [Dehalococcoidia bacterium]|nr:hypothetical protein [Dehalococcoidia bacterium]
MRPVLPVLALALSALLAAAVASPTMVTAAGGDIDVFTNEGSVHFPGDVVFNLGVEAPSDIQEVKIYFRIPPSQVWMYAYPDVDPSPRVETSFRLDLRGVDYLPPGTEIEYYYQIRDASSSVFDTERNTLFYVDDRYRWDTTTVGPLTIFSHDVSGRQLRSLAEAVEGPLREIGDLLEMELERPMRGVLYNSQAEARDAFPVQSRTTTERGVFAGYAFPDRGVFIGVGLHPRLVLHESAHILLEAAVDSPTARIPGWLNEGFASYVETRSGDFRRSMAGSDDPLRVPLRHMQSVTGTPSAISDFYRKSESVVGYLLESYGDSTFRELLSHLHWGRSIDHALETAYGFDQEGLDRRWASALTGEDIPGPSGSALQREGPAEEAGRAPSTEHEGESGGRPDPGPRNGLPFQFFDTLAIAVLALAVVGVMSLGFLMRRLRDRGDGREEGDRLTEDEWRGRP